MSARNIGAFAQKTLSDGVVLLKSAITISGNVVTIPEGYLMAGGRLVQITEDEEVDLTSLNLGTGETGYIILSVDSDNYGISFRTSKSNTVVQSVINLSGGTYEMVLTSVTDGALGDVTYAGGAGGSGGAMSATKLWTNSAQTMAANSVVTINNFSQYSWFYVLFQRAPYYTKSSAGKSVYGQWFYVPAYGTDEYSLMASDYNDTTVDEVVYANGIYYRADVFVPIDATSSNSYDYFYSRGLTFFANQNAIMFHKGRYSRRTNSYYYEDDRTMVPILIYGM